MTGLGEPEMVAEADSPWGRVRVTLWTRRPLATAERAQLLRHLGRVHTRLLELGVDPQRGLDSLRESVVGPHAAAVAVEVLPSPRALPRGVAPAARPSG